MSVPIQNSDLEQLKQSLPDEFENKKFLNETNILEAFPILNMICKDRFLIERLKTTLHIPKAPPKEDLEKKLHAITERLRKKFSKSPLFVYRLPIVLSEFPIHSRAINKAIHAFNLLVEEFYKGNTTFSSKEELVEDMSTQDIGECFFNLLKVIEEHGKECQTESLWQLLQMMSGWSKGALYLFFQDKFKEEEDLERRSQKEGLVSRINTSVSIKEETIKSDTAIQDPFLPNFNYNFDRAGRIDSQTMYVLQSAFAMKPGGHTDSLLKNAPRFLSLDELHALIRRQLSHRITVNQSEEFKLWIESILMQLGVQLIQRNGGYSIKDILVSPFLSDPISFISPEKIHHILYKSLEDIELEISDSDAGIIAQYLYELIQGFQMNPGIALGIGANWDGTVNRANESDTYPFKFCEKEAKWGRLFKNLSIHRQVPSERLMNAGKGFKFEIQSIFTDLGFMSQLQPSEYEECIYNALVDNLVSELFPEPAYFENEAYLKFRKIYVLHEHMEDAPKIESFFVPDRQGSFYSRAEQEEPKQTPMHKPAGTENVVPFPKKTTCSEQLNASYAENLLVPQQLQYAQAMYKSVRGDWVYNPIGPDTFLEDPFCGQVVRSENGDYLPFIGVIPKNFDRLFNQDNELCASFVLRMLQSSRIMVHCPTFQSTFKQILSRFLPPIDSLPPKVPESCSQFIVDTHSEFLKEIQSKQRSFERCERQFFSLFKNIIYSLYEFGKKDEHFKPGFLSYVQNRERFEDVSRSKCDKLIRDFRVNRPVNASIDDLKQYDDRINYLRTLTSYFYPNPCDFNAKEIAKQAELHVKPLMQSKSVKEYFERQQKNKHYNLSRKQSPGMVFSALLEDETLHNLYTIYNRMHRYNFNSFSRDSDGTPFNPPQTHESLLDWGTKKVGFGLRFINKYQPQAILTQPIARTYMHTKQSLAKHQYDDYRILWGIKGGFEGFIWHGLIKGVWKTTTSPFRMLGDLLFLQYKLMTTKKGSSLNNPLAISAAPANEPSPKTIYAAEVRDFLIQLMDRKETLFYKKISLFEHVKQQARKLYPRLEKEKEDLNLFYKNLFKTFPLSTVEWSSLFDPILSSLNWPKLSKLLQENNMSINNILREAVYRCITHPKCSMAFEKVLEETQKFFDLRSKQKELFKSILGLYHEISPSDRSNFLDLFKLNGDIHKKLINRDQLIQKIHSFMLEVFDEQKLMEFLFASNIDTLTKQLNILNSTAEFELMNILEQIPDCLKGLAQELIQTNEPKVLDEYMLSEKEITFFLKFLKLIQSTHQEMREKIILFYKKEQGCDDRHLSIKEKAHRKWVQFAERELKHEPLNHKDFDEIIMLLSRYLKQLPKLAQYIEPLKEPYANLDKDDSLNTFYDTISQLDLGLSTYLQTHENAKRCYLEAHELVCNLTNITMNVVINRRLDAVDINSKSACNPLLNSIAIEQWLVRLRDNQGLSSLLDQQEKQSPSLDHALRRCTCIFQVLEQHHPMERIKKTGMQRLLRFWSQSRENILSTGEVYENPKTHEFDKGSYKLLIKDSRTMEHAMHRVAHKLPKFSIFRGDSSKQSQFVFEKEASILHSK